MKKITLPLLLIFFAVNLSAQLKIDNATFFIQPGATVSVQGDVTSNVDIQGTGLLLLNGSSLQNVDMGGFTIPNLELNNNTNANLLSNARIGNSFLFTLGKIQTGNFNLTLGPTATITGGNASRYVLINGTGQLKKELTSNVAAYELPVGENANYRPAYLTITGSPTYASASFGVRVTGAADAAKPPMTASFLKTTWPITSTGITGGTVALEGQYLDPTDVTGTEANLVGYFNNGTDWSSTGETHNAATNRVSALVTSNSGVVSGLNKFLAVGARAFLQGCYVSGTGLMSDNLRTLPFGSSASTANFPSTDPYRVAPYLANFPHVNNPGIETIASATVLDNPVGTNDDIVDWVFLDLRTIAAPTVTIQTRSALIQRDGDIVDVDGISPVTFNNLANGSYTLAVRHRNHLGLRTDNLTFPKTLTETKSTAFTTNVVDLRTATDAQLFGTSTAFRPSTHPTLGAVTNLWAGNANSNTASRASGILSLNDYLYLNTTLLGGNVTLIIPNIYSGGDMNMDKSVRSSGTPVQNDYIMLLTNVLGGDVTKIITQQL